MCDQPQYEPFEEDISPMESEQFNCKQYNQAQIDYTDLDLQQGHEGGRPIRKDYEPQEREQNSEEGRWRKTFDWNNANSIANGYYSASFSQQYIQPEQISSFGYQAKYMQPNSFRNYVNPRHEDMKYEVEFEDYQRNQTEDINSERAFSDKIQLDQQIIQAPQRQAKSKRSSIDYRLSEDEEVKPWEKNITETVSEAVYQASVNRSLRNKRVHVEALQSKGDKKKTFKGPSKLEELKNPRTARKRMHISLQKQLEQISEKPIADQLSYIDSRIQHYLKLKQMVLSKQPKDRGYRPQFSEDLSAKSPKPKQVSRIPSKGLKINKNPLQNQYKLTPQILQNLSKKFQLYHGFQSGKYDPIEKKSLNQIASSFRMGLSFVNQLYCEWLNDPTFSQKRTEIQRLAEQALKRLQTQQNSTLNNKSKEASHCELFDLDSTAAKTIEIRYAFSAHFSKLRKKGVRLYYLDECPKELIFGTNKIDEESPGKEINFSLMVLLGVTGRASWKVVHWLGSKYQQIKDIEELYRNVREDQQQSYPQASRRSYFILDNAILKEREKMKQIEAVTGSKILFLPQLSRQLNPLEMWFAEVRNRLKIGSKSLNQLNKVLQIFSGTDFSKYLTDSDKFIALALQKQHF